MGLKRPVLVLAIMLFGLAFSANVDRFIGEFKFLWLEDGRKMKLLNTVKYVDPNGLVWTAAEGRETDGASIPQIFWSVIGGPYEGKYRKAAVIHDIACEDQTQPWEATHRMFYDAMITAKVDRDLALLMYGAVYNAGLRWSFTTISFSPVEPTAPIQDIPEVPQVRSKFDLASTVDISTRPVTTLIYQIPSATPGAPLQLARTVIQARAEPPKIDYTEADLRALQKAIQAGTVKTLSEAREFRAR
jgi:Protein of unknown function (DUF1353)